VAEKEEELTTLTVSGIPVVLVDEIDEMAEADSRSRSKQTMLLLKEIVAIKRSTQRAGSRS
jgi:hypothetical protein